jgi:putative transposase
MIPERGDSLAVLFRRVHGAYAQAVNAGLGRSGHLWQNRFYSCPLSGAHLWVALRYVEANPVRAGLAVRAEEYLWSSAAAHLGAGRDGAGVLDGEFWERSGGSATWREMHAAAEQEDQVHLLRRCTYAGRPFGEESFVVQMEGLFQRQWRRWSFEKATGAAGI